MQYSKPLICVILLIRPILETKLDKKDKLYEYYCYFVIKNDGIVYIGIMQRWIDLNINIHAYP